MTKMTPEAFLLCPTPPKWLDLARDSLPILLIDHANCEKKAASTAMNLLYKYIDRTALLQKLSRLAREELRHFEQVLEILIKMNIEYEPVSPSRYAGSLRKSVRTWEPARLVDVLIVGAIVEARSCERFNQLIPFLADSEPELADFYASLVRSESRHFNDYLDLARLYAMDDEKAEIEERIEHFLEVERSLIESPDQEFRFHSGLPPEPVS